MYSFRIRYSPHTQTQTPSLSLCALCVRCLFYSHTSLILFLLILDTLTLSYSTSILSYLYTKVTSFSKAIFATVD
jgi:hypothetical protein